MWKTWNWATVRVKKHFSDVGQCYAKRFLLTLYLWATWDKEKEVSLTKSTRISMDRAERARARLRGPREVKAFGFGNLKWLYVLCRLRVSTLLFKYRCCLSTRLRASEISHNWVYVFSSSADEEVTFEVACSFKFASVAQRRLQPWRHLSLLSKLFPSTSHGART